MQPTLLWRPLKKSSKNIQNKSTGINIIKQPCKDIDFSHKRALKILFTYFNTTYAGLNFAQLY